MSTTQIGQNSCYIAYETVGHGLTSGTVTFNYGDTKWPSGTYEVRYFLGDSAGGNGQVCRSLDDTSGDQTHCALEAATTSSTFTVMSRVGTESFEHPGQAPPGFEIIFN